MKKKIVLAMAIIMVLGSVKAMALSFEDENQITKTYAAEQDWKERQNLNPIEEISNEVREKISKIRAMKDADQVELSKAAEATAADATARLNNLKSSQDIRAIQDLSAQLDDSFNSLSRMDQRNDIRGLRVHEELRY